MKVQALAAALEMHHPRAGTRGMGISYHAGSAPSSSELAWNGGLGIRCHAGGGRCIPRHEIECPQAP
eukprot:7091892-Pyramimonas_sp.AAC.1